MTDVELARISLVALDSLEARFSGTFSFGLIRRALQGFEAISEGLTLVEEPASERCRTAALISSSRRRGGAVATARHLRARR